VNFYASHDGKSWLVRSECAEGRLTQFVSEEVSVGARERATEEAGASYEAARQLPHLGATH
jgi:hypothetical protein